MWCAVYMCLSQGPFLSVHSASLSRIIWSVVCVCSSPHFHRPHSTQRSAEMVHTFWSAFYPLVIDILQKFGYIYLSILNEADVHRMRTANSAMCKLQNKMQKKTFYTRHIVSVSYWLVWQFSLPLYTTFVFSSCFDMVLSFAFSFRIFIYRKCYCQSRAYWQLRALSVQPIRTSRLSCWFVA